MFFQRRRSESAGGVGLSVPIWSVLTACLGVGVTVAPSLGAIIITEATVSTTVQELIDGSPGSVNSDRLALGADTSILPLSVLADLASTDLDGQPIALGEASGMFADPTRLDQPNPEEFALEVAGYSNAPTVSYSVRGQAVESRTIVFTTEGNALAPVEIEFRSDATRVVESSVFISGAVVLWSTEAGKNLTNVSAELRVSVMRESDTSPLFETTLLVAGNDSGKAEPTTNGPMVTEVVTPSELSDLGLDPDSVAVLESLQRDGTLVILTIPSQEHIYSYVATADEPLVLTASFEARVRSAPDGTGAAAVLGSPFVKLAEFIKAGLPGVDGVAMERAINTAMRKREVGIVQPPVPARRAPGPALCGAFGVEVVGMLLVGLTLIPTRRRRPA